MREISFPYVIENFRKNKYLFVWSMVLSFGLTIAAAFYMSPKYQATITLVPNEIENNNELTSNQTLSLGGDLFGSKKLETFDIFLLSLYSKDVYERIAQNKNLIASILKLDEEEKEKNILKMSPLNPNRYIRYFYGIPAYDPLNGATLQARLGKSLVIKNIDGTHQIAYSSKNREDALILLNYIITYSDEHVKNTYKNNIKSSLDFLSKARNSTQYPNSIANAFSRRQEKMAVHYAVLQNDYPYSYQAIENINANTFPDPPPLFKIFGGLTIIFLMLTVAYSLFFKENDGGK